MGVIVILLGLIVAAALALGCVWALARFALLALSLFGTPDDCDSRPST